MVGATRIVESNRFTEGLAFRGCGGEKRSHGFRDSVRMCQVSQLPRQGHAFGGDPRERALEFVLSGGRDGSFMLRAN